MLYLGSFFAVFGIYVFTLNPSVTLGDGGELVTAAFFLGIAHAPGYPLYTQLGKLFTLLPFGSIAFRLNLMSGCFAALTFLVLAKLLARFTKNSLISLSVALTMAFLPIFWRQALMARVYPLHIFIISLIFYVILQFQKELTRPLLYLIAFLMGLGLSSHQMSIAALLPFLLVIVTTKGNSFWRDLRGVAIFITFMILGLSLYLHLPIRSALNPVLDWWDPQRWQTFYESIVQVQYHGKLFSNSWIIKLKIIRQVLESFAADLSVILIIGALGVVLLFKQSRQWGWPVALLCLIVSNLALGINYLPEKEAHLIYRYLLMSYLAVFILLGCGISGTLNRLEKFLDRRFVTALSTLFFIIPLMFFFNSLLINRQEENFIAYDHALNVFKTTPDKAVVFTGGDNDLFPLWYLREVERWNPETSVIGMAGLKMDWYIKALKEKYQKHYPNLFSNDSYETLSLESNYPFPIFTLFNIIPEQSRIFIPPGESLQPLGITFHLRHDARKVNWEENRREWRKYSLRGIFDPLYKQDHQVKDIFRRYAYFFNDLGFSQAKNNAVEEAIASYRMAIVLEENWKYHYNLGLALLKKHEPRKALKELQVALRLEPKERPIQYAIAITYSLLVENGFK